jgi:hypothetical protein
MCINAGTDGTMNLSDNFVATVAKRIPDCKRIVSTDEPCPALGANWTFNLALSGRCGWLTITGLCWSTPLGQGDRSRINAQSQEENIMRRPTPRLHDPASPPNASRQLSPPGPFVPHAAGLPHCCAPSSAGHPAVTRQFYNWEVARPATASFLLTLLCRRCPIVRATATSISVRL